MPKNAIIYSSRDGLVERNARVYSVSLRFDRGSNYFSIRGMSVKYLGLINQRLNQYQSRLLFYEVMPNHVHLVIETPSYDVLAKAFKIVNGVFSKFLSAKIEIEKGMGKVFGSGPRYHAIHSMKQFFYCLKYLFDNPKNWNNNPAKKKIIDISETYRGGSASEILEGTSRYFNADALKKYTGFSNLMNLVKMLLLPKAEFQKDVELVLIKRQWNEQKDSRVFKIDPNKPWTNPYTTEEVCYEEETEKADYNEPIIADLETFIDL